MNFTKIVQEIAHELLMPLVISYFLCDSWYTCGGIMDAFIKKGFYTIGALKTNQILYLCGIKQKVSEFALHLRKTDAGASSVTVGSRNYYVYRYEGSLNGIDWHLPHNAKTPQNPWFCGVSHYNVFGRRTAKYIVQSE